MNKKAHELLTTAQHAKLKAAGMTDEQVEKLAELADARGISWSALVALVIQYAPMFGNFITDLIAAFTQPPTP